jgi:hypothetical protein
MLRVETGFQDTPGGRPLRDQLDELCLKDGARVILYEDDCCFETEATLLFDHQHPMMFKRVLWARAER